MQSTSGRREMFYDDTWGNVLGDGRLYITPHPTRIIRIEPDNLPQIEHEQHEQHEQHERNIQQLEQQFIEIEATSDFYVVSIITLIILIVLKFVLYYSYS
jgi:hypothetical protein